MVNWKKFLTVFLYICAVVGIAALFYFIYNVEERQSPVGRIIIDAELYKDGDQGNMLDRLIYRVHAQPFNLIGTIIFFLAVTHTFFARKFSAFSNTLRKKLGKDTFSVEVFRFMGEVEVIFGIWVIPLLLAMAYFYNWDSALNYINGLHYREPLFVVVIMALASTGPILTIADGGIRSLAKAFGGSVQAWWWIILTVGPLLGSLITEPGAMTISALLMGRQFFSLKPSRGLAYASLALLFVNISVGGVLTSFAAPPVLMVSRRWAWDSLFMLSHFGWKAIIGILASNAAYYFWFKKEFIQLESKRKEMGEDEAKENKNVPLWISFVHIVFLVWVVMHSFYPVVMIGTFLFFLGFYQATLPFQTPLSLKTPVLVGFFLTGLVIHGSLQGWWISLLLTDFSDGVLFALSTVLTAFNDNAEITFLSTLIPTITDNMKYAIVAGAVTGGGLTVIANAPNPAGQAILNPFFGLGISAAYLFRAAIIPTVTVGLCFFFL